MIKASGSAVCQAVRSVRFSMTMQTVEITTASALNSHCCQPPALARKLNAAPVLCTRVQFQKPGTTSTDCM